MSSSRRDMCDMVSRYLRRGSECQPHSRRRRRNLLPVVHGESDSDPFLESDVPNDNGSLHAEHTVDSGEIGSLHDNHFAVQSMRREIASDSRYSTSSFERDLPSIVLSPSSCVLSSPEVDKV